MDFDEFMVANAWSNQVKTFESEKRRSVWGSVEDWLAVPWSKWTHNFGSMRTWVIERLEFGGLNPQRLLNVLILENEFFFISSDY